MADEIEQKIEVTWTEWSSHRKEFTLVEWADFLLYAPGGEDMPTDTSDESMEVVYKWLVRDGDALGSFVGDDSMKGYPEIEVTDVLAYTPKPKEK